VAYPAPKSVQPFSNELSSSPTSRFLAGDETLSWQAPRASGLIEPSSVAMQQTTFWGPKPATHVDSANENRECPKILQEIVSSRLRKIPGEEKEYLVLVALSAFLLLLFPSFPFFSSVSWYARDARLLSQASVECNALTGGSIGAILIVFCLRLSPAAPRWSPYSRIWELSLRGCAPAAPR